MIAKKCEKSVNHLDLSDILDTFRYLNNQGVRSRIVTVARTGWIPPIIFKEKSFMYNWITKRPTTPEGVVVITPKSWLHNPVPGPQNRGVCLTPVATPSYHGRPQKMPASLG
jgi:hypothetical protein